MRRLAKEVSLVGCDDIDERNEFFLEALMRKQVIAILGVGAEGEGLEPALDAHLEHGLLFRSEADAGLVINKIAEAAEVAG